MTEIASRYLAVWREPELGARRAAIASLWAPDGVEYVEGKQFRGHAELEKRVAEAHQQFVADRGFSITWAGEIARHDDIITGTAQFVTLDLEVVWSARIFLVLREDGLIQEDYQLTVQPLAQ
jgi:hypothetical protein